MTENQELQQLQASEEAERKKELRLDQIRFLICFPCASCGELLDYKEHCANINGKRTLFCNCGWTREIPMATRFVNYDPSAGGFTCKWDEDGVPTPKRLRSIRLTELAWSNLEKIAQQYGVNRPDLIEAWARSLTEDDVATYALEQALEPKIGSMVLGGKDKAKYQVGEGGWLRKVD